MVLPPGTRALVQGSCVRPIHNAQCHPRILSPSKRPPCSTLQEICTAATWLPTGAASCLKHALNTDIFQLRKRDRWKTRSMTSFSQPTWGRERSLTIVTLLCVSHAQPPAPSPQVLPSSPLTSWVCYDRQPRCAVPDHGILLAGPARVR